jgi:hypothetical protein
MLGISWVVERLLATEEGLGSMKLLVKKVPLRIIIIIMIKEK